MRAISTVVDVVLCLLLVSAAVVVVSVPTEQPPDIDDEDTADLLSTSTVTLEYRFGSGSEAVHRQASGTYTGLLARAAVANATLDGTRLSPASSEFVEGVTAATASVLGSRTHVTARWQPYDGAPIRGVVTAGTTPPIDADLHVTTRRVPVPVPSVSVDRDSSRGSRTRRLARAIARGLLPASSAAVPQGGGAVRADVGHRYEVLAGGEYDRVRAALAAGNVSAATAVTAEALGERLAPSLEELSGVQTGTVTITIRRWDA